MFSTRNLNKRTKPMKTKRKRKMKITHPRLRQSYLFPDRTVHMKCEEVTRRKAKAFTSRLVKVDLISVLAKGSSSVFAEPY